MRKMNFLMLVFFMGITASMNAQVTIGSEDTPTPGTVLDLQSGGSLGLLLPNVKLTDEEEWFPMDGVPIDGMQVFTDGSGGVSPGVYVWFNEQWNILVQSAIVDATIPVTGVGVNPSSFTLTAIGEKTTLHPVIVPSNATNQTVSWSDNESPAVTVNPITGEVTADATGTATVTVTTQDGNFTASASITVDVAAPPTPGPTCTNLPNVAGYTYKFIRYNSSIGVTTGLYLDPNVGYNDYPPVAQAQGYRGTRFTMYTWVDDEWSFTSSSEKAVNVNVMPETYTVTNCPY
jgi:hypothetical protein